jgi:transcription elongation GreA/GreB family factor
MTFKQKIHQHYLRVINDKIQLLQQVLASLKESGANETKSTAGDKHETALAMLQIEQANIRAQLKEMLEQKGVLERINPALSPIAIVQGSLVKTNWGYLFVSVALGKTVIDDRVVIALSAQSPLGKQLMGLQVGNTATVNSHQYIIQELD